MARHRLLVLLSGIFGSLLFLTAAQADGCQALRKACMAAGFVQQGAKNGDGIQANCINPLTQGQTPPGNGKLALPKVSAADIKTCAGKTQPLNAKNIGANRNASGPAAIAAKALPAGAAKGPNIVVILVDDFSMNLLTTQNDVLGLSMPNVAKMMQQGVTFANYFVTDSLCCPSRTSIFTGLMPHNSGVYTNTPPDGGYDAFMANHNDARTFAVALHDNFYQTAMMGKYLNLYDPGTSGVPQGWSNWAVAGNGYPNFNYVLNTNNTLITPPLHLTDELSDLGVSFIQGAKDGPFYLELATFSPHAPYVPPDRYKDAFPTLEYPRTPAYGARPDANAPKWLQNIPGLEQAAVDKMTENFRNRVRSDKGIDDLVGAVHQSLQQQGLAENTYVVFTSDNGYHMGEYSLRPGKMTAFDTDIHVPLIVVGPGIAAGSKVEDIAMNIDLYPTFTELAGLAANPKVDGHSLVPLLHGQTGPRRNIAVVEHKYDGPNAEDPDQAANKSGDPPDYVALRMPQALYVEYQSGSDGVEYYDLKADPYELHNIAGTLSAERLKALHDAMVANHACKGAAACAAAQNLAP